MNRDLVKFMDNANSDKKNVSEITNVKNVSVNKIRKTDKGLYFNIKLLNENKEIEDIFISNKFFQTSNETTILTKNNKNNFLEYFIIYPFAIASLGIIFATIFKYLPILENFLNFSFFY